MSAKRISRRTAEQILRGSPAGHPVADLLRRAAAPGGTEELTGEARAMAAFQSALVGTPVPSESHRERRSSPRSLFARTLTAKVAGITLAIGAVGAIGGVAIAANGGVPGVVQNNNEAARKPSRKSVTPTMVPKYAVPPSPAPSATPNLVELCKAYLTQGRYAKQLAPLIKAAGGRQKVLAYCFTLLGGDRSKPGGGWPTKWPDEWPKDQKWPTEWPQGWPSPGQGWGQDQGRDQDDRDDQDKDWGRRPRQDKNTGQDDNDDTGNGQERQFLWPEGWPDALKF